MLKQLLISFRSLFITFSILWYAVPCLCLCCGDIDVYSYLFIVMCSYIRFCRFCAFMHAFMHCYSVIVYVLLYAAHIALHCILYYTRPFLSCQSHLLQHVLCCLVRSIVLLCVRIYVYVLACNTYIYAYMHCTTLHYALHITHVCVASYCIALPTFRVACTMLLRCTHLPYVVLFYIYTFLFTVALHCLLTH